MATPSPTKRASGTSMAGRCHSGRPAGRGAASGGPTGGVSALTRFVADAFFISPPMLAKNEISPHQPATRLWAWLVRAVAMPQSRQNGPGTSRR